MRRELFATLATRVVLIALSIATAILTARLLGPSERGAYFLALTTAGLGVQLLCLGVQSSNTYIVAANKQAFAALHANSLWITVVSCLVILLVGLPVAVLQPLPLEPSLLVLALLSIPPGLYYLYGINLLLGVGETARFNRFELLSRAAPLLLMLVLAFWPYAGVLFFANLAASVVVAILLFRANGGSGGPMAPADTVLLRRTFHYGAKAYVFMLLGFLLARIPVFILSSVSSPSEVGQLSIALQMADMMSLLPTTVAMLLFPRLVKDKVNRNREFVRWLRRVAVVMSVGCVLIAGVCDPVVPLLFGEPFRESVTVMYALLPGVFFLALISVISQYLASIGLPWSLFIPWAVGICASAGLGSWLMPTMGAQGAAVALSCAYAAVLVSIAALCMRRYRLLRNEVQ